MTSSRLILSDNSGPKQVPDLSVVDTAPHRKFFAQRHANVGVLPEQKKQRPFLPTEDDDRTYVWEKNEQRSTTPIAHDLHFPYRLSTWSPVTHINRVRLMHLLSTPSYQIPTLDVTMSNFRACKLEEAYFDARTVRDTVSSTLQILETHPVVRASVIAVEAYLACETRRYRHLFGMSLSALMDSNLREASTRTGGLGVPPLMVLLSAYYRSSTRRDDYLAAGTLPYDETELPPHARAIMAAFDDTLVDLCANRGLAAALRTTRYTTIGGTDIPGLTEEEAANIGVVRDGEQEAVDDTELAADADGGLIRRRFWKEDGFEPDRVRRGVPVAIAAAGDATATPQTGDRANIGDARAAGGGAKATQTAAPGDARPDAKCDAASGGDRAKEAEGDDESNLNERRASRGLDHGTRQALRVLRGVEVSEEARRWSLRPDDVDDTESLIRGLSVEESSHPRLAQGRRVLDCGPPPKGLIRDHHVSEIVQLLMQAAAYHGGCGETALLPDDTHPVAAADVPANKASDYADVTRRLRAARAAALTYLPHLDGLHGLAVADAVADAVGGGLAAYPSGTPAPPALPDDLEAALREADAFAQPPGLPRTTEALAAAVCSTNSASPAVALQTAAVAAGRHSFLATVVPSAASAALAQVRRMTRPASVAEDIAWRVAVAQRVFAVYSLRFCPPIATIPLSPSDPADPTAKDAGAASDPTDGVLAISDLDSWLQPAAGTPTDPHGARWLGSPALRVPYDEEVLASYGLARVGAAGATAAPLPVALLVDETLADLAVFALQALCERRDLAAERLAIRIRAADAAKQAAAGSEDPSVRATDPVTAQLVSCMRAHHEAQIEYALRALAVLRFIGFDPRNHTRGGILYLKLARVYAQLGAVDASLKFYETASSAFASAMPGNNPMEAMVLHERAAYLASQGSESEAKALLRRAARIRDDIDPEYALPQWDADKY